MIWYNNDKLLAFFTDKHDHNIAYHVTDNTSQVDLARIKLAEKYNFDLDNLHYMDQIHSNKVNEISNTCNPQSCDALITDKPNTPLMVMVADCIPILFYDPVQKVIGAAHAGRIGTFEKIVVNTVKKMEKRYRSLPKDIQVILGPSIQKCCYEVNAQMAQFVKETFGENFVKNRNIDLQGINTMLLLQNGIQKENITISKICTKCSDKPYFSYRNDPKCGRFAGVIMLIEQYNN
jgi:YfiH family protein